MSVSRINPKRLEKIIINDAMTRQNLAPEAFREGYVQVDEYSLEDLMAFSVDLSRLIHFFNLEDEVDGDWAGFFLTDPAFVLAYIAAVDIGRIENRFATTFLQTRNAHAFPVKFELLVELFRQILYIARMLNLFLKILDRQLMPGTTELKEELVAIIREPLRGELRKLRGYAEGAAARNALDRAIDLPYQEFLQVWEIHHVKPDDHIYGGRSLDRKIDCAIGYLQPVYDAFLYQLIFIRQIAVRLLPEALAGPHKPHIALYLTFLELYGSARRNLNTLTHRYRDLYYWDILQERQRSWVPDRVFLCFRLGTADGVPGTQIRKDTLFPGGTDENGEEILYGAEEDSWVSQAALNSVHTIFTQYQPLIPCEEEPVNQDCGCPPPPKPRIGVAGIYSADLLLPDQQGQPMWPADGFPALGSAIPDAYNQYATIGFTIASDTLLLTGGNRTVRFTFTLTDESRTILYESLAEIRKATGVSEAVLFQDLLQKSFTIFLSTENGWFEPDGYHATVFAPPVPPVPPVPWPTFEFSFLLPAAAPAITPLPDGSAGGTGKLPAARFLVRQGPIFLGGTRMVRVYPLSFFSSMRLRQITIAAAVTDLTQFTLQNNLSGLDTSGPFNPFGTPPVRGAYLEIAGGELFSKEISSLNIELGWYDLPWDKQGFTDYYQYYTLDTDGKPLSPRIGNDSFRVTLSTINPGSWELREPLTRFLFSTKEGDVCERASDPSNKQPLCSSTLFAELPVSPHEVPLYYSPADSRIRIELVAPVYAFGNDLYPINLMNAVVKDLPWPHDGGGIEPIIPPPLQPCKELKFPNAPYTPQATFVTVSYTCFTELSFETPRNTAAPAESNRFFHLFPFDGYELIQAIQPTLLPEFYEGNLLLGLTGLEEAQTLSFLFSLGDRSHLPGAPPALSWSYLADNCWVPLTSVEVLADGTGQFQDTGIIRLKIPSFSAEKNTILSPDLKWVRATASSNAAHVARIRALYAHALTARWQGNAATATHLAAPLPPFSIQSAASADLDNIEEILQPLESFGGRPAETREECILRAGERLNHKQRAVLPQDYERLVLRQFPEVWKVKCLPHFTADGISKAGHVLVIVVQGPDSTNRIDPRTPVTGPALLAAIKNYLERLLSPMVRLAVCNPVYVAIRVDCTVQLVQGEDNGERLAALNRELVQYLSPWRASPTVDGNAAAAARSGYYPSPADISDFIQKRPYVAFLDAMTLSYDPDPSQLPGDWYFLTSAPAHTIRMTEEKNSET